MQTWRRQTIIVGICFAVVMLARFYFKHNFAGMDDGSQGIPATDKGEVTGSSASDLQDPRDTVVTLDPNP
jgi:hypothetical protein